MPVPSFSSIKGDTQEQLVDSLEKLRKELWWLLQSLDTTNVKELNAEVINAGRIEAKYLKVGHETEFEEGYDTRALFEVTNDRITAEVASIDGDLARLEITANQIRSDVIDMENNLSSSITQTAAQIRSEVSAQVTSINGQMATIRNDVSSVTQTASQIQSTVTSQQAQISNQGTRLSSAESSITQQSYQITQKVSQTDYNGNTIASLINQTATTIRIQASKIQLVGAVSVLSDITGALGTITSGHINISESATIGTTLQIGQDWQASYAKAIRFAGQFGTAGISYNNGSLTVSAVNEINLDADFVRILGTLSATVQNAQNASSLNGYTLSHSTSAGKTYITFRYNGSYLGQIQLAA